MLTTSGLNVSHLDEIEHLRKQDGDVTGVRRWLLLYRPEGIECWIVHSLFYLCALFALVLKVRGVMVAVGALHGSSVWLAPIYFTNIIDPEANAQWDKVIKAYGVGLEAAR